MRVSAPPHSGGLCVSKFGRPTVVTHQAGEEAIDEGLESGQRRANYTNVTLDRGPNGSAVVVVCELF